MVDSIGSSMASSMMMRNNNQGPQQSGESDLFQVGDTDGDGVVSSSELSALEESGALGGSTLNVDESISTYDVDGDSSLSGEELFEMLSSSGSSVMGQGGESGEMPPPPPPPAEDVTSAYEMNSGEDESSTLLELLEGDDEESIYSSINITT